MSKHIGQVVRWVPGVATAQGLSVLRWSRRACYEPAGVRAQGAGKWFPRMLQWADRQWRWRNPYTGHVMRYFDNTDIVTQLPDAFNFKPYW